MTDKQRRALWLADNKAGARVRSPGRRLASDDVAFQTAEKLVLAGWATLHRATLRTTVEGRKARDAPQYDDGLYLHAKSQRGYTTDPRLGLRGEPQPMGKPSTTWQAEAQRALVEAKSRTRAGRREQASGLALRVRASGRHGWRTSRPKGEVTTRWIDEEKAA